MEDVENNESVLSVADAVREVQAARPGFDRDSLDRSIVDTFGFAEPEEVLAMADFFGVKNEDMLEGDFMQRAKEIYKIAQRSPLPLSEFLSEAGVRVGGRFEGNFVDRVYTYLSVLSNEADLEAKLRLAKKERETYEGSDYI